MADKKSELSLNTKTHSIYSVVSFVLALVGLMLLILAVVLSASYLNSGAQHQLSLGLMVIVGMMCNFSGIVFGVIGELLKDYFKAFAHIGLGIHGVLLIINIYVLYFGY